MGKKLGFISLLALLVFAGCSSSTPMPSTPIYSGPTVEYEITGTARLVDVTLSNATGGTEQYGNVHVPCTYSFDSFPNYFLYISAQNQTGGGSVVVSIYIKGNLYKTASSSGAYVIATASGTK